MKKQLLIISAVLSLTVSAQNGGQYYENASIKIEQDGYTDAGLVIIKLTNKQTCTSGLRLTWGNEDRTKIVGGELSDTFHVSVPANRKVRAKNITNCGATDFGNVEIDLSPNLPLYFAYKPVITFFKKNFKVNLKPLLSGKYNIQVSTDGKTFKTVETVAAQQGKEYSIIINKF